jgi:hypothetical protein
MDNWQKQNIIQQYTRKKKLRQKFILIQTIVVILLFIGFDQRAQTIYRLPAMPVFFMIFALIVFSYFYNMSYWKCPACKKYLGRTWNPKHCENCGVQLVPDSDNSSRLR